jgi:hypothetical protein
MATRRGPDNSVRVAVSGTINSVNWANVFWCQLTTSGTPSQTDLDTWLTAFAAAYKTRFQARQTTFVNYTQAQAGLFLPGSLFLPSIVAMTGAGTATTTATFPQEACSIISWLTGVYWRGGKPRTYSPHPPSANVINNKQLNSTEQAALLAAALGFRTDVNALTSGAISATSLGFVSFISGGADRTPPLFFAYTGAKVHPRLGTQRRRLGKWLP